MPDAYSQLSETLDSYIDAKLSQFRKEYQSYVKNYRFGSAQILPQSITMPKLNPSIDDKIANVVVPLIADSQITTFYQADTPTANVAGTLWIDTDAGNALKRWDGSSWVAVEIPLRKHQRPHLQ